MSLRALKILVISMGVLICVGFAVVAAEVSMRIIDPSHRNNTRTAAATVSRTLALPAGARIEGLAATADRVVVHARLPDGTDQLYILDPANGTVSGGLLTTAP